MRIEFLKGLCVGLSIFLFIVSRLPENKYNHLFCRQWLSNKNNKHR